MVDTLGMARPASEAVLGAHGSPQSASAGLAIMAVLAGPGDPTADDAQTVAQNVPFVQTANGAPLLFPGAENFPSESEASVSFFPSGDDGPSSMLGAETSFDCGAGSYCDGDGDWSSSAE